MPIDWLELDVWRDFDPFLPYSEPRKQLQEKLDRWWRKQLSTCVSATIPFNSRAYDEVTREKYEWLEEMNPEAHRIRWVCRHQIMLQRIKNAIGPTAEKRYCAWPERIIMTDSAIHFFKSVAGDFRLVHDIA